VDFARAEIRRGTETIDLTALELKLIRAFARQPGRVLERTQLVNEVWGHGVFVTDRVVDTHIVKVRRKIEPDPARPRFIVSVRGLGYRFDP
jgi:DNA-binding response OmpR family regulator